MGNQAQQRQELELWQVVSPPKNNKNKPSRTYVCCLDDLAALVRGISGLAVLAAFGLTALDACLLGALGLVPAALG